MEGGWVAITVLSIHFPLTREDDNLGRVVGQLAVFQSTSLSRGKTNRKERKTEHMDFQSTSLSRGKTMSIIVIFLHFGPFNPLPSHEGRRELINEHPERRFLSIHFPLTREDAVDQDDIIISRTFQSTSLSRGKT